MNIVLVVAPSLQYPQCAITVFDGLLPEPHNRTVTKLLFVLAHWHSMAKLRMHNDLTLAIMEEATTSLGKMLRTFSQKTCSAFATKELSREYNSRIRREGRKQASAARTTTGTSLSTGRAIPDSEMTVQRLPPSGANGPDANAGAPSHDCPQPRCMHEAAERPSAHVTPVSQPHPSIETTASNAERSLPPGILSKGTGRRHKTLNLSTFKSHSAGDYVGIIREYGTCDSYSTEPVCYKYLKLSAQLIYPQGELEHRTPKGRYARTNRKHFLRQMTQIERRQARLRRIRARHRMAGKPLDEVVATTPEAHHSIGISQNHPENVTLFVQNHMGDPAIKVIIIFQIRQNHPHIISSGLCI